MTRHAVLMGDPAYFRIKAGANYYTRNRWGLRKRVNRERAAAQWQNLKSTLESLGARVFVLPPQREFPGTVFPANAGFLYPKYERKPPSKKFFYLSNLTPHREKEKEIYGKFLSLLGFSLSALPNQLPFEGEADFFPCGSFYIFSYGEIRPVGFQFRRSWPPCAYQFSHRSDQRSAAALEEIVEGYPIIEVRLTDVRYYHGDTALFAFGRKREHVFAYLDAIDRESQERLRERLKERLIPISREDAETFAANSFQLDTPAGPHIVFPAGVSQEMKQKVSSLGFAYSTVDVSEFFEKGGGSVKCLLCDLGPWSE